MQPMHVLVLNSGSSSIKFSLFEAEGSSRTKLFEGAADGIGTNQGKFWIKNDQGQKIADQSTSIPSPAEAFTLIAASLRSNNFPHPTAIGHRMVSGGPTILHNQRITPDLLAEMERYTAFAPLHTPIAIYIMRQAIKLFPGVLNFVCLDTYFHRTIPEVASLLPIPAEYSAMGVRRYGFHGLSYESIVFQLGNKVPEKLIVAHLGNGASISAIRNGKCIDTSMGLTPTGGIISATRTGDIDPGALLFILREIAKSTPDAIAAADKLEDVTSRHAGLLGMSELSNDMRALRESIANGNAKARRAVDKFVWTIQKWIGSYFALLGGLDMLVFTGGIGENDSATRAEVCSTLGALGIRLDAARNSARGAAIISADDSPVQVRVIPPAEDLMIVNHVVRMLAAS